MILETFRLWLSKYIYLLFLWVSGQSHSEFISELLEEAEREYKSERMNSWYS